MKTYMFYSPSEKEFMVVVAENIDDAIRYLNNINTICGITTHDYIIGGSVDCREGSYNTFHIVE